jgi:predicted transposase YbfD/YdcC
VGLTLGQEAAEAHSNEIPAIPKLLATLDLAGAIVTIDAMGRQKEVAKAVRQEGGDYLLAVKENQETSYRDVVACTDQAVASDLFEVRHDLHQTSERGHGRREERTHLVIHRPSGLTTESERADLKAVVLVRRRRWAGGQYSEESHYYTSSAELGAAQMAQSIRGHWGIENGLHWVLDVVFREDHGRVKDRNAAENLALLRRVAVSLLKQDKSKGSLKGKRKRAGWDEPFLLHLLGSLAEN